MSKLLENFKQNIVEEGLINSNDLAEAEMQGRREGKDLLKIISEKFPEKTENLVKFIGEQHGIPFVKIKNYSIDPEVLKYVPEKIARRYKIIPLFAIEDSLTIAISDPLDIYAIDDISKIVRRYKLELVIAPEESIIKAIDKWYANPNPHKSLINQMAEEIEEIKVEESDTNYRKENEKVRLEREAKEPLIVKLVNSFIVQAILEGASDIHIEPKKKFLAIRFRIDGFLHEKQRLPVKLISPVTSRIKIMSEMDISKRRIPQDGRITLNIRDRNIDVRSSTLPSIYGEKVVLRILDKSKGIPTLVELGLSENDLGIFKGLAKTSSGLILACGPTGSGKTTSIYSLLDNIDKINKNVVSIENPIEYEMEDVVQSQIEPLSGATFPSTLRAILRQDPDVIYVGEIRDNETAEIALRAALTGHLVISTIHTIDSVGTITRLRDMDIAPAVIGSVLNCTFSQRLIRKLCPICKKEYFPEKELIKNLGLPQYTKLYKKVGCKSCNGIGYSGRIGLFEVMKVNNDIRTLIYKNQEDDKIRKCLKNNNVNTLFKDGLSKVATGLTTLEEVIRVTEDTENINSFFEEVNKKTK